MEVKVEELPGIKDNVSKLSQSAKQAKEIIANLKAPEGDEIMPSDVNDTKAKEAVNEVIVGINELASLLQEVAQRWNDVEGQNESLSDAFDGIFDISSSEILRELGLSFTQAEIDPQLEQDAKVDAAANGELVGNTNTEKLWNFFLDQGFTEEATAALMGNLMAESGIKSVRVQGDYNHGDGDKYSADYTNKVDTGEISEYDFVHNGPGGGGYGLAQWTWYTRKQGLYDYAQSQGTSVGDLKTQAEYLVKELKEDYSSIYNTLQTSHDMNAVSDKILTEFERPADIEGNRSKRRNNASDIYNDLSGTHTANTTSSGGTTATSSGTTAAVTATAATAAATATTAARSTVGATKNESEISDTFKKILEDNPSLSEYSTDNGKQGKNVQTKNATDSKSGTTGSTVRKNNSTPTTSGAGVASTGESKRVNNDNQEAKVSTESVSSGSDSSQSGSSNKSTWNGKVLTKQSGIVPAGETPSGYKETYYDLNMDGCLKLMGLSKDGYAVREDGVKTYNGYVMVASPDLNKYPKGSYVETTLGTGMVVDYCPEGNLDIAVTW